MTALQASPLFRQSKVFLAASVVVAACWAAPAQSYKISIMGRYHERMTVWAERCLAGQASIPIKCTVPDSKRSFTGVPFREGKYWAASRWSDDPTRQTTSPGLFKFGWNVAIDRCVNYIGSFNDFPGVLCNGHYGTMQFLHAMASVQPGETVQEARPEPFENTRKKMVNWTAFAFQAATGKLPANAPYCQTVRSFGDAGAALAPPQFRFCDQWTVGSLFGFTCGNVFASRTCSPNVSEAGIRRAATGALLHMIQDSYSRSHTGRGETLPLGPYKAAEVRCRPIQAFYRYSLEQKKVHGSADKAPDFSDECASEHTMDPITASAQMIWLVENVCDASWAKNLVSEGVIANRPVSVPTSVDSCRRPKVY